VRKWVLALVGAGGLSIGFAVPSFAAFDYTNTFTPVSTELQVAIGAIVPIVLIVFAIILGIRLGMSLVRRVVGR